MSGLLKEDERLYHYTTLESFANIVKTGVLWASHIGCPQRPALVLRSPLLAGAQRF
jgi:hypothetical protein